MNWVVLLGARTTDSCAVTYNYLWKRMVFTDESFVMMRNLGTPSQDWQQFRLQIKFCIAYK